MKASSTLHFSSMLGTFKVPIKFLVSGAVESEATPRDFRQLNDCVPKHLHANVLKAFECLDLARVCRFARKTREYMRGYARMHMLFGYGEDDKIEGFSAVEKFYA